MIADTFNEMKNEQAQEQTNISYGSILAGCIIDPRKWNPPVVFGINIPGVGSFKIEELKQLLTAKKHIQDMLNIQGTSGNFDSSEYMRGLCNGLILAINCFGGEEVELKSSWVDPDDAPELTDEWFDRALKNKETNDGQEII